MTASPSNPEAMRIEWPEVVSGKQTGRRMSYTVPRAIAELIEIIGMEATVKLLISCGGSPIALPKKHVMNTGSVLVDAVGPEHALSLGRHFNDLHLKVPIGNKFIARQMASNGASVNEIARTIRQSDVTVRKILGNPEPESREKKDEALSAMFDRKAAACRSRLARANRRQKKAPR